MFKAGSPIAYDAPAELKKWAVAAERAAEGSRSAHLVYNGMLAECVRELMVKPIKGISLYDIMSRPQAAFDQTVLSPGDAAEIAMRKDFPKGLEGLGRGLIARVQP